MFKETLQKLIAKQTLSREEAYAVMTYILEGKATSSQISSFITILTFRGINSAELIGLTTAMRDHATPIDFLSDQPLVDTCGTGGDGARTFNVSTASALVASSSGVAIAKHGNRSVSSLSGSADVLEELGIAVDDRPQEIAYKLATYKMCFMFAPLYHQTLKHAAETRREVGFRSVLNLLGPLTNPAGTKYQVMGIFDYQYSLPIAEALRELGSEHVLVLQGEDGLDELSISTATKITELREGEILQYTIAPEDVGLKRYPIEEIQVESVQESAQLILNVLRGKERGAAYEMICFNAGAALYVGQKVKTLREGVQSAQELIDSGRAYTHYLNMTNDKGAVLHA